MVKQIIKRIIVGVSVALILSLIYSNKVFGLSISEVDNLVSYNWGNPLMTTGAISQEFIRTERATYFNNWSKTTLQDFTGYDVLILTIMPTITVNGRTVNSSLGIGTIENMILIQEVYLRYDKKYINCDINNTLVYCRLPQEYKTSNIEFYYNIAFYTSNTVDKYSVPVLLSGQFQISPVYYFGNISIEKLIQQETQALNDINNTLNDDTPPSQSDVSSVIDNKIQGNSTISETIMAIPNILGVFGTTISGTCSSPYNFGRLYNYDITFNCINPSRYLGSTIWSIIDIIFCIAVIVPFSRWVINAWNRFTSLKEVQF